jgi:hypothetical protein
MHPPIARPTQLSCALTALGSLLMSGCTPSSDKDWLPLDVGLTHHYSVTQTSEEPVAPQHWTLKLLRTEQRDGVTEYIRHHSEGVAYHLVADAQGVRRVATQLDTDTEPQPDKEPRWVLKRPYGVGTEWSTPTVPYLSNRRNEYPKELKNSHSALMTWRIEALDEEVQTAAGRFKPCMRVQGTAQLNLYTDPVNGFTDVPLISREWYCQGVGLVKFEREEKLASTFMLGGTLTAELSDWSR